MKTFYATTPIYYVNDLPHIGHIYTTVVTDVVTRFRRLAGEETRFLTGTDEHGQNIEKAAAAQGITPIAARRPRRRALPASSTGRFEIRNDDFIRTTEARHRRGVEALIARIEAAGDLYTAKHEGWYCSSCEVFYTEKELDAEKRCPVHGRPTVWESEENVFFRLSKYAAPLLAHYERHPEFVRPESRLRRGRLLRARRPERPLRLPHEGAVGDPVSGAPGPRRLRLARRARQLHHGARVRLARTTRTTGGSGTTRTPSASTSSARTSCASTRSTGRRSCCRPGCRCRRPSGRTAGGCATRRRSRSPSATSCGRTTSSRDFGPDALRYFLLREMAFGQDASFSDEAFLARYNADLANDLGNTVSRVAALCRQSFGGTPNACRSTTTCSRASPRPRRSGRRPWRECQFNRALEAVWRLLTAGQRLRRRPRALEDPQGRGRRLRPPPPRALRGGRGRAPRGRHALAVHPRDEPEDLRDLRAARRRPDARGPRLGPAPVSAPMPEAPALFPRADAEAYFKEKDAAMNEPASSRRAPPAAARRPGATTASRSRTSRRSACARRRSSPPSGCPSRTS